MLHNILKQENKHITYILVALVLILFSSCKEDETPLETKHQFTVDEFAKNWQAADLSKFFTGKEVNYPISTKVLQQFMTNKQVAQVRFVPGVINNEIYLKIVSVDVEGNTLKEKLIEPTSTISISKQLSKIKNIELKTSTTLNKIVARHAFQPKAAYEYIISWNEKSKINNIDEMTSYNGERIRYFSFELEVIAHMSNLSTDYLHMSWGLNEKNKLTTVFIPTDNNTIQLGKNDHNNIIYDIADPCPPTCCFSFDQNADPCDIVND